MPAVLAVDGLVVSELSTIDAASGADVGDAYLEQNTAAVDATIEHADIHQVTKETEQAWGAVDAGDLVARVASDRRSSRDDLRCEQSKQLFISTHSEENKTEMEWQIE